MGMEPASTLYRAVPSEDPSSHISELPVPAWINMGIISDSGKAG
jgi:hypothetical protein